MARVPLYQQGQLASSVVGTPGVSTSQAELFGDLSKLADTGTKALFVLARDNQLQAIQAQRELAQIEAARKTELDKVHVANYRYSAETQLDELETSIKEANAAGLVPGQLEKEGLQRINAIAESIQDAEVRTKFVTEQMTAFRTRMGQVNDWRKGEEVRQAQGNMETTLDRFAVDMSTAKTPEEALQRIQRFSADQEGALLTAFGQQGHVKLRQAQERAVVNYFSKLYRQNPALMLQMLERPEFSQYIDEANKTDFYNRYKTYALAEQAAQKKQYESETRIRVADQMSQLNIGSLSNKTRLEDYDAAIAEIRQDRTLDPATKATLISQMQKQRTAFAARQQATENKIGKKELTDAERQARQTARLGVFRLESQINSITDINKLSEKDLTQLRLMANEEFAKGNFSAKELSRIESSVNMRLRIIQDRAQNDWFGGMVRNAQRTVQSIFAGPDKKSAAREAKEYTHLHESLVQKFVERYGRAPNTAELTRLNNLARRKAKEATLNGG